MYLNMQGMVTRLIKKYGGIGSLAKTEITDYDPIEDDQTAVTTFYSVEVAYLPWTSNSIFFTTARMGDMVILYPGSQIQLEREDVLYKDGLPWSIVAVDTIKVDNVTPVMYKALVRQ